MEFTLAFADMDCGIDNPAVALAIALSALSFGAWMAWVLISTRPYGKKALHLALVFAGSIVGSWISQGAAISIQAAEAGMPERVGCIGRPPALLSPAATLMSALMAYSAWWLWRRMRPTQAS